MYELPGVARRGEKEKCRTFFNGNFSEKKLCHRAERVDDGYDRNVVRIDADEFTAFFLVGNNIVDGGFGGVPWAS